MNDDKPRPSTEPLGAALIALDGIRWPGRAWLVRRAFARRKSEIAEAVALAVETATRDLCAREIATLDDPKWREAIETARALITYSYAERGLARQYERLMSLAEDYQQRARAAERELVELRARRRAR